MEQKRQEDFNRDGKLGQGLGGVKKKGGGLEPPHELCYMLYAHDFISCTCFSTLFIFHASAAFKWVDIQNFAEGGRTLYGGI